MQFGLSYNTGVVGTDPANLKAIARHVDDLGFESLYLPEHVTLYPGARVGEVEFAPDLPIADPLECLSFVAASTTTILLGTGVLLLPFHHPVVLAKRLATIDVLSGGRMRLLTIGVSSLRARLPPSESTTRPVAAALTRRSTSCARSGPVTPPARVSTASSTRSRT